MFAFKIIGPEVKLFMNKLLREEVFDKFEVRGVEISTLSRFSISGVLDKEYLEENESISRNYCLWKEIKPYVLFIIKNNKRPKLMKLTFSFPQKHVEALHKNAAALFINITFEHDEIMCSTVTSEKNFSMEKTVDAVWENKVKEFLSNNQIAVMPI